MKRFKINITKDTRPGRKSPYLVRWYGKYDPTIDKQKRYCKSFARRKDAERFISQKQSEFDEGLPRDQRNITLEDLCEKFQRVQKNNYAKGTMRNYIYTIQRLTAFFGNNQLVRNIRQEDAEEFIAQVGYIQGYRCYEGKDMSDSAKNIQLRNSKKIFNKALEWHYIRANPFSPLSQVKAVKQTWHYISPEEFKSILAKMPTMKKAFFAVQYGCGLRAGEVINILWNGINIDFETNRITLVNRPGSIDISPFRLKDYEQRSVPMPKWVVDLLLQLHDETNGSCPFVFITNDRWKDVKVKWDQYRKQGRQKDWENKILLNNSLIQFKKYCKDAGIKTNDKLTQHCLRKSWACNLADNGVPAHTLMKMGGWSSIETVQQFYLKTSDANEKKAVEMLDRLMEEETFRA